MVEPPAAAPSRVAEQDVLLATKLHVPRAAGLRASRAPGGGARRGAGPWAGFGLRPGRVRQDGPAGRLGPARPAAGDVAVAGRSRQRSGTVWRHAAAALDRVSPGIAERVNLLLGPPAPASFEGLVTALTNELAAQPGADEMLLILDDYQLTRQACRADGERAELVHLDRAGVRRRNRLRAVGHRPLPRRAAPPRRPAPGDDHRGATPRCAAHRRGARPAEGGRGSAGDWAGRER
jgi:hypothetical protein